jgi:FdhD protein
MALSAADLLGLMRKFQTASPEFQDTGAVHSAALATATEIRALREDIGRHNAIDKLLGWALINGVSLDDKIMLSSGRISSEIVLKTKKTTIPVLVSRSAPTNQAIRHAQSADITLIGFARGRRMNVYSGTQRIQA